MTNGEPNARTERPFESGPFLQTACLCEKVLEERDGVKSAIRIIDRLTHTVLAPAPPEEMEPFDYTMTLLVKLKAGAARGTFPLTIRLSKPSGESPPPIANDLYFEGEDDRGVDVAATMTITFTQPGLYWFDISLADVRLTRIPFRLIYSRQTIASAGRPPQDDQGPAE